MSEPWYVGVDGRVDGPHTADAVIARLNAGSLSPDTLAFSRGVTPRWTAISSLPVLMDHVHIDPKAPAPPLPAASNSRQRKAHEIDHKIHGDDIQWVEIELDPGETVVAEAGALFFMTSGIEMESRMGDGSQPDQGLMGKLLQGAKRVMTGESLFLSHYTKKTMGKGTVAFAAPTPGRILAMDLAELGGELICQKDAFLCCAKGVSSDIAFQRKLGAGFFGGEGFILQRLRGDGYAFIHASGALVRRTLAPGEVLRIDTGCVVAYQTGVDFDIQMVKGVKSMLFGGEGLFLATLTGPGDVWLQSMPFSRMADKILSSSPRAGGAKREEGSLLGGLAGNLLSGD